MSNIAQYIIKNINLLNIEERYTVCKILIFRDIPLQQSNNGVYTFTHNIDENTLHSVYIFLKTRLGG